MLFESAKWRLARSVLHPMRFSLPKALALLGVLCICCSCTGEERPSPPPKAKPKQVLRPLFKARGSYVFRYMDGTNTSREKAELIWIPSIKQIKWGYVSPNNSTWNQQRCVDGKNVYYESQVNPDGTQSKYVTPGFTDDRCRITFDSNSRPASILIYSSDDPTCPVGNECASIAIDTKWISGQVAALAFTGEHQERALQSEREAEEEKEAKVDKKIGDLEELSPGIMSEVCSKSMMERTSEENKLCYRLKTRD